LARSVAAARGVAADRAAPPRRRARVPRGINGDRPAVVFEQYERHTAWDRPVESQTLPVLGPGRDPVLGTQ